MIEPNPDSDYWFANENFDFEIIEKEIVYVNVEGAKDYYSWTGSAILPEFTVCTPDGEAYTDYVLEAYKYDEDEEEYYKLDNLNSCIAEGDYRISNCKFVYTSS